MVSDEIAHLGFALHHQRGAYALLIGSGVSSAAGIMTGENVLKDFIRTHAEAIDEPIEGDPRVWYHKRFVDDEPTYSNVLQRFAKHPNVRSSALDKYFTGKAPSPAHHAIADLVREGYIKVIITTNFDRLIEQALEGQKVTVVTFHDLDRGDAILPLQHVGVLIFKLHGDYVEGELLNTPEELETYKVKTQELLTRIVDEYGLIACGWSADSDVALRKTILANTRQRYPLYFCHYTPGGEPSDFSKQIIDHRDRIKIDVTSANKFFSDLLKVVRTYARTPARPFNREIARTETLRLLATSGGHIEIEELWRLEVERVYAQLTDKQFYVGLGMPDKAGFPEWIARYLALMDNLLVLTSYLCWYGEGKHSIFLTNAISRLAEFMTSTTASLRLIPVFSIQWVVCSIAVLRDEWRYVQAAVIDPKVPKWRMAEDDPRTPLPRNFPAFIYRMGMGHAGINTLSEPLHASSYWVPRLEVLNRHVLPLTASSGQLAISRDISEIVYGLLLLTGSSEAKTLGPKDYFVLEHASNPDNWTEIEEWVATFSNADADTEPPSSVLRLSMFYRNGEEISKWLFRQGLRTKESNPDYPAFHAIFHQSRKPFKR